MNSKKTSSIGNIERIDVPTVNATTMRKIMFMRKDRHRLIKHHLWAEFDARMAESYCFMI